MAAGKSLPEVVDTKIAALLVQPVELISCVMSRRMPLGIKQRTEAARVSSATVGGGPAE